MARTPLTTAALLSLFALGACQVGAVGSGGDDDNSSGDDDDVGVSVDARVPMPSYRLSVAPPSASTSLGTEVTYVVAVDATDFTGPVELAAVGAPDSWNVTITPSTVDAVDGTTATAMVRVVIPPNGDAAETGRALAIHATATPGAQNADMMITVANEYDFPIAAGTGTGAHWGSMSGGLMRLRAGTTLKIQNNDTIPHRVHSGGGVFPHQDASMGPGASYTVVVQDGSDTFYCHDHGQGTGEVNVNAQ
jgi:hypothetical protein